MSSPSSMNASGDSATSRDDEGCSRTEDPSQGSSLHKRRFDAKRGDLPETLTVHTRRSRASPVETSSPRLTEDPEWIPPEDAPPDMDALCTNMLQRLEGRSDPLSARSRDVALATKATVEALDHLERLYELMDQLLQLKENNERILRKARDAQFVVNLANAHRQIEEAMERARREGQELTLHNEALNMDLEDEYGYTAALLESLLAAGRGASVKRAGSRWKAQKFRGSLLRKQRSKSVGGEESEGAEPAARLSVPQPPSPRRRADDIRRVDKAKVSKWTWMKAAIKWEKEHAGVAAGAVGAAGALVGAVALAGTSAPATPVTPAAPVTAAPAPHQSDDANSVTPASWLSLTPNSSCEELRMEPGICRKSGAGFRCDENDNSFLQAPTQEDSSTSPSPNKLNKSPWGKMRDIIHTRTESVRRGRRSVRAAQPPGLPPAQHAQPPAQLPLPPAALRRRSLSDGCDSDAPPALTLTIPSSEELEGEQAVPGAARKMARSPEHGRPPAGAGASASPPARPSKWSKVKRAFLTGASASVPCSPDRHRQFFADRESEALSSGCEAGGVRDEIQRDYAALQSRLGREFSDKRDKLYGMRPVATEDQLSADFRKKLAEWQRMKGGGGGGGGAGAGSARQPPPVPDRSDLSEDFLKKWDEWKRLKETNSVPAWAEEARPDEVLVQTSTGFFRFQGISRSFTRKLHEWEKARGIAPEASTSALLRAAQGPASPAASTPAPAPPNAAPAPRARHHASSLSVNDADKLEMGYVHHTQLMGDEDCGDDGWGSGGDRAAVLVEVEAEEEVTAAPLVAVTPRHTPQKPIYTYDHAEPARLLCETSTAALVQREPGVRDGLSQSKDKNKASGSLPRGSRSNEKKERRPIIRQPSIEDDAQFIRRTIEEIERGSSSRVHINEEDSPTTSRNDIESSKRSLQDISFSKTTDDIESSTPTMIEALQDPKNDETLASKSTELKSSLIHSNDDSTKTRENENEEGLRKRDQADKVAANGKKKLKTRARLEREHSKPSESDSEPDMDTVTVEIPRRRKRPRRPSERPRTPPPSASAASDTEGEVFVLKLRAPDQQRCGSPEVIVKTKRKIFSPVVRSGESTPRAVIPVDVEELDGVRPRTIPFNGNNRKVNNSEEVESRLKCKTPSLRTSQDDLGESKSRLRVALENLDGMDDQKPRSRPPLPSSPSAQRRVPTKETAPSIRIMIQRYNLKINEDGHTSPASSGTTSPAWRSPAAERRRPPDMPNQVNIRNNPFVAREVQKSVSACQLSRREASSSEKRLEVAPVETGSSEGVLKSHSACALHPMDRKHQQSPSPKPLHEEPESEPNPSERPPSFASTSHTSIETLASSNSRRTAYMIPSNDLPSVGQSLNPPKTSSNRPYIERLISSTSTGSVSRMSIERIMSGITRDRRPSVERLTSRSSTDTALEPVPKEVMTPSERAQRIRAARERFLSSPGPVRRDVSGSAGDLRPGDRCSRASCSSDVAAGGAAGNVRGGEPAGALGRSASTGMVNVERDAWDRVCEGGGEGGARRSRFSLARLAGRLRRRADPGAVSRLCRQSLLVQLRPQQRH